MLEWNSATQEQYHRLHALKCEMERKRAIAGVGSGLGKIPGVALVSEQILDGIAFPPSSVESSPNSDHQDPLLFSQSDASPSSLSAYEYAVSQDKKFIEKFKNSSFEQLAKLINNTELFKELAAYHAPFLLSIRKIVNGNQPVRYEEACEVSDYVLAMFTPRLFVKGSRAASRTDAERHRDNWMLFLGATYKKFFNPILPHESGKETWRLKNRLAACLRTFVFGSAIDLKFKSTNSNQITSIGSVSLPETKSVFKDLSRKFKNRRDNESKYLKMQFLKHHQQSPPSIVPSPKKGHAGDQSKSWKAGRNRTSTEYLSENLCPTIREKLGFEIDVSISLSPSKRLKVNNHPELSKRSKMAGVDNVKGVSSGLFAEETNNDTGGEEEERKEEYEEDQVSESNSEIEEDSVSESDADNNRTKSKRFSSVIKETKHPAKMTSSVKSAASKLSFSVYKKTAANNHDAFFQSVRNNQR